MKKIIMAVLSVSLLPLAGLMAQTTTPEQYQERYNALVAASGQAGVGIETLIDKWIKDYPDDSEAYQAAFLYYFAKSRTDRVIVLNKDKYLGEAPVLSLNDSLGNKVNYFQDTEYDDELFGKAIKSVEKASQLIPLRLDVRLAKVAALVSYEKESPDMACSELKNLIDYNASRKPQWEYPDTEADAEFFAASIQEFCYTFFKYASPACYEAFKDISLRMLNYEPDNVLFLDNMGSYFLVAKRDYSTALKYYNKVLKKKPDDLTAIQNCIILARNSKNVKLEKKYLPMLIRYSDDENAVTSAKVRLEYLNK